ncbi:uncharacterized protein MELLADRAFT_112722 [Melampsora larici-populina 98AG31]|uniref:DEAD/DEAH box helicase domain-containing protein n=1 Tax=Melampsora larici-populina (strain 98AG31 / pathotype 3-4-7) TaxID=747676 RepID=F4S7D6_MELLP|nr:uncharacterized protein MELLADRAFT_112722 [Melampsora larici-populina 98AG31]EGF99387.1 hypothetical protein MELLADRAFT_112722 [Melampsora larici-populina 98AG31]
MLRRSHSARGATLLAQHKQKSLTTRPKKQPQFINASEESQRVEVGNMFQPRHGYPARPEQIQSVVDLLNDRTSFLLAGTGFGKSRVPEMYYHAHETTSAPIILCINPLDALGDDQVSEKEAVDLRAINLTGENCTQDACDSILLGDFVFVYVVMCSSLGIQMISCV